MTVPTPRTGEQLGKSVEERLGLLESRRNDTILPGRLTQNGQEVDDWNDATRVGYYWSADGYVGQVLRSPSGIVQQRQKITPSQDRMETRSFDGVWSPWRREDGLYRGTATERGNITPAYWDMWQDTDSTQKLYVGSKTGTWRQFCGEVAYGTKTWDVSSAPIYGRTDVATLAAVVLEANETLAIALTNDGGAYGALTMFGLTKNPTNTQFTTRFTAFLNATTRAYSFAWSIQQI